MNQKELSTLKPLINLAKLNVSKSKLILSNQGIFNNIKHI